MYSAGCHTVFSRVGFPIRRSTGRRLLTAHRRLSQFCHVLLRLLVPRHPPNALTSLTTETFVPWTRKSEALRQVAKSCLRSPLVFPRYCMIPDARPQALRARGFTSHAKSTSSSLRARTSFIYSIVNRGPFRDQQWARQDLNLRPRAYQARALTS